MHTEINTYIHTHIHNFNWMYTTQFVCLKTFEDVLRGMHKIYSKHFLSDFKVVQEIATMIWIQNKYFLHLFVCEDKISVEQSCRNVIKTLTYIHESNSLS